MSRASLTAADLATLAAMRAELSGAEEPGGAVLLWSTDPARTARASLVDRKDQTGAAVELRARLVGLGRQVFTRAEALTALDAIAGEG